MSVPSPGLRVASQLEMYRIIDGEREAKAKVVASVWGAEFIKFLATQAVLPRSILKNRMNSIFSSKSTEAK